MREQKNAQSANRYLLRDRGDLVGLWGVAVTQNVNISKILKAMRQKKLRLKAVSCSACFCLRLR